MTEINDQLEAYGNGIGDEIDRIAALTGEMIEAKDLEALYIILGQLKAVDGGIRTSDAD